MKNQTYWAFNLPVQAFPVYENPEDKTSQVVDYNIVNYMPRKEKCVNFKMSEVLEAGQTKEEYFLATAAHLENLALLFKKLANNEVNHVYYPDEGMDKSQLA